MVHNEAAAATTRRQLTSTVWDSFTKSVPAAGEPPTATCGQCGKTLRAGSSIGTSHLRRHTATKKCQQRAAERRRRQQQLLTAPTPADDGPRPLGDGPESCSTSPLVYVEEELFVVDGMHIPRLFDDLNDKDLVNIDRPSEGDEHFAANHYVGAVPQAANYSTRWFHQKRKERKGAASKKRCAREDESGQDLSVQTNFSSRGKMLPNSAGATTATIQDHSHASNK